MATYTTYKNLEKPSITEKYNVAIINKNSDIIDSELHKLELKNQNQDDLFVTKETLRAHSENKNNPHQITKSQIGLSNVDNTLDIDKPVSTAQQDAIDLALTQSNHYTDLKIADLINGAPETLDTLKELADALSENETFIEALNAAIGEKASQTELDGHINNSVIHVTSSNKDSWNSAVEHISDSSNPHNVTKNDIGLSNVENKSSASIRDELSKENIVNALGFEPSETGGSDGSSIDISLTLSATGWTGEAAPYTQSLTVPQMREGMTPLIYFSGAGDGAQYAYSLITGYEAGYAEMIFYAADLPEADIDITLKGIPAQQLEYADNTLVVVVPADGFILNEDLGRYEQTIAVEGMTPGMGGLFDIVRSGPVLTLEESKIVASITDIIRLEDAIKIVCLEPPAQQYMLALCGTYTQATEGTTLLAGMQGWFDKVDKLEDNLGDKFSDTKAYATGDRCIYQDVLYKFITNKDIGAWDETVVEGTTIGKELSDLNAKILWENPDPSTAFAEQDIILNSADYNRLEIYYKTNVEMFCQSVYKGFDTILSSGDGNAINEHIRFRYRHIGYISDTTLHVGIAYNANYDRTISTNQSLIVPFRVLGYKS